MVKNYQVKFLPEAVSDLRKIDKIISQRILDKIRWLAENFQEIAPDVLTGKLKGMFKLRVGDWRIIYTVSRGKKLITIHMVGHRREIYNI